MQTTNQANMAQCPCGMSGPFDNQSRRWQSRTTCGIITNKDNADTQHWATWTWDDSDPDPINWRMTGRCFGQIMPSATTMTGWRATAQPTHMAPHQPGTARSDDRAFCGSARATSMRTTAWFDGWWMTICPGCSAGMDFFS